MGQAEILGNLGDGLYTILVKRNRALLDAHLARIADALTKLAEQKTGLQEELVGLQGALDAILAELDALIDAYDPEAEDHEQALDAINAKMVEANTAATPLRVEKRKLATLDLDVAALTARQNRLNELAYNIDNDMRSVWCADLSDELTGAVSTMEVIGQPDHILIAPQQRETGENLPSGALTPILPMSPAQAAFNWAILPGWQKWRPTYRTAIISNIDTDADTCNVSIDGAWSVAQSLHVNQESMLTGVPVEYMDCNAAAFEEGDQVVVEFREQKWEQPAVVGFVTEPRGCDRIFVYKFRIMNRDGDELTPQYMTGGEASYPENSVETVGDGGFTHTWPVYKMYRPSDEGTYYRSRFELQLEPVGEGDTISAHDFKTPDMPWWFRGIIFHTSFESISEVIQDWVTGGLLEAYAGEKDIAALFFNVQDNCYYFVFGYTKHIDEQIKEKRIQISGLDEEEDAEQIAEIEQEISVLQSERFALPESGMYLFYMRFIDWANPSEDNDLSEVRKDTGIFTPTQVTASGIKYNDRSYGYSISGGYLMGEHGEPNLLLTDIGIKPSSVSYVGSGKVEEFHVYTVTAANWRFRQESNLLWQNMQAIGEIQDGEKAYTNLKYTRIEVQRWYNEARFYAFSGSSITGLGFRPIVALFFNTSEGCCEDAGEWVRKRYPIDVTLNQWEAPLLDVNDGDASFCNIYENYDPIVRLTGCDYPEPDPDRHPFDEVEGLVAKRGLPTTVDCAEDGDIPVDGTYSACPDAVHFSWVLAIDDVEVFRKHNESGSHYIDTRTYQNGEWRYDDLYNMLSYMTEGVLEVEDWEQVVTQWFEVGGSVCMPAEVFFFHTMGGQYPNPSGGSPAFYAFPAWRRYKECVQPGWQRNAKNVSGSLIRFTHNPQDK